jgi:hypothetical protein
MRMLPGKKFRVKSGSYCSILARAGGHEIPRAAGIIFVELSSTVRRTKREAHKE